MLFSGFDPATTFRNDTWVFDGSAWTVYSLDTTIPQVRSRAQAAFDVQMSQKSLY